MIDPTKIAIVDESGVVREVDFPSEITNDERPESSLAYRIKLGRVPISLTDLEYRILKFLASRPYHAFTPRSIAAAVTTDHHPVVEETLGRHITTLRDKLGFFGDYVQSVPYIGYRFKE